MSDSTVHPPPTAEVVAFAAVGEVVRRTALDGVDGAVIDLWPPGSPAQVWLPSGVLGRVGSRPERGVSAGLLLTVFAVLDAHGYRRGDGRAVGAALRALNNLVRVYESNGPGRA